MKVACYLFTIRYSLFASWNHLADRAGVVGGEEQPAVGNGDDGACAAACNRDRVFADDRAVRPHATDLVGKVLGEPEVAVRRHGDAAQGGVRRLDRPFGDAALRVAAPE